MPDAQNVIVCNTLEGIDSDQYQNYLAHAMCLEGSCGFS